MSIGIAMLSIYCGALDKFTCRGAKPLMGCWFPYGGHIRLFQKFQKSDASCAIKLTSCIDLTMAMSLHFIALYKVGTSGVKTLSSKFLCLLNPLRKRLIISRDAMV